LRKLSPNAAKNWHQNKGVKRRVVIRDKDMGFSFPPFAARRPYYRSRMEARCFVV
jgi:hypothetical protein